MIWVHLCTCPFISASIFETIIEEHQNMVSWPAFSLDSLQATSGEPHKGPPRNLTPIGEYKIKPELLPPKYEIKGTDPASKILFVNVNILESSGREPYKGSVYIQGSFPGLFLDY